MLAFHTQLGCAGPVCRFHSFVVSRHMPFTFQFQLFYYDTAGFFGCECLFRNVEVGSTHTHYQGIILFLIHHHCFCRQERENIIGSRFGIFKGSVCHGACQNIVYGMHLAVALYHFVGGCRHMGLQFFSRRLYPYHVFVASIFGSCSVSYPCRRKCSGSGGA